MNQHIDPLSRNTPTYTKAEIYGLAEAVMDKREELSDELLKIEDVRVRKVTAEVGLFGRLGEAWDLLSMLYAQVLVNDDDRVYLPDAVTVALFDAGLLGSRSQAGSRSGHGAV